MSQEAILETLHVAWLERRSDLRQSFHVAKQILTDFEGTKESNVIAECHKILGYCYWRFSDYTLSMEHSLLALEFYRSVQDLRGEADTLNNLGAVYMFQKNHEKRLDCNLKCLALRVRLGHADDISGSMNNIGETYFEMGDFDSAQKWFQDCISFPDSSEDSIAWGLHNLGKLFFQRGELDEAIQLLNKSLAISVAINYDILSTASLINLSEIAFKSGDILAMEQFAEEALNFAIKCGAKEEQQEAFLLLSTAFELAEKHKEALELYKQYHTLFREIHDESNHQRLKDMEFTHELDTARKEAEIERLKTVELKAAYDEIGQQKELLEARNKEIVDSIRYAQRIQQAVLKDERHVSSHLPDHFILFKPKDIVSGDFYWAQEKDGILYVAAADCTGHGVPGGFLTMLGIAFLNEIITKQELQTPASILNELRDKFINEFGIQDSAHDGMDIALISFKYNQDTQTKEIMWAGANNPLWVVSRRKESAIVNTEFTDSNNSLVEIYPDKQPIGNSDNIQPFTDHRLLLQEGDMVYIFSDGFQDQFGGDSGKKLKRSGFKSVLLSLAELPVENQLEGLEAFFDTWRGEFEQVDDICVIGIRL
jgi:serine phosphatase RsbU (regulator of sigma subunit)